MSRQTEHLQKQELRATCSRLGRGTEKQGEIQGYRSEATF